MGGNSSLEEPTSNDPQNQTPTENDGVNSIPIATFDTFVINRNATYEGELTATDADGDRLKYIIVTQPEHGTVVMHDNGCFTYTPVSGYQGSDTFSYKASDDVSSCAVKTVTVDVCEPVVATPTAPTNLTIKALSTTKLELTWRDNANNEEGFVIYQDGKLVASTTENETKKVICCGLEAGKTYTFEVRAKNEAGTSTSASAQGTTNDVTTPPVAPSELKAKAVAKTSLRLEWKDNADNESSYEIYQDGVKVKTISSGCHCSVITGLSEGTSYSFVVKAVNKLGSGDSESLSVTTKSDVVVVPPSDDTPAGSNILSGSSVSAMSGATIELYDAQNRLLLKKSNAIDSSGAYSVSFDADEAAKLSDFFVLKAIKGDKELDSVIIGYWGDDGFSGDASYLSYDSTAAYLIALYTGDTTFENIKKFLLSYRDGAFDKTDVDSYKYPYRHIIEQVSMDVKSYIEGNGAKPTKESILAYTMTKNIIPADTLHTIAQEGVERFATSFVFDQNGTQNLVELSFDVADSNITQDIDLSTANLEDLSSGDFEVFNFSMDIGDNVLRDVYVEIKDLTEVVRSRSRSFKKNRAAGDQEDFCNTSENFQKYVFEAVKKVEMTKSNICSLIDWDNSQLYYENSDPVLKISFKRVVVSSISRPMVARFKTGSSLSPFHAFEIPSDNTKKIFTVKIKSDLDAEIKLAITTPGLKISLFTIGNVLDYFNHTHIKDSILAYKTLKETRAIDAQDNASDHWNNYINSNENEYNLDPKEPLVMNNVMTHRITDFDEFLTKLAYPKHDVWSTTDYAKSQPSDDGRIPLLLVHGWQGSGGMRNPAVLGLWKNSEFQYFNHFLDYYLTSKALQKKYHVYLYRYMSYKHVTYNAWQLEELLEEVKTNHPDSDLAKGLNDSETGLTILAHSMGGLVSRSLIEEHQYFGSDLNGLNKLITLDTPHHGSTSAEDYGIQNWIKDLGTHGSADLNWDNYDKSYDNKDDGKYIDNNYIDNRWNEHTCNAQEFDEHYSHILKKWKTSGISNPYLTYLNNNFKDAHGKYTDKYIFYTAWHTQDVKNSDENKILEFAGKFKNSYIKAADYIRKFFVEGYFAYNRDEKHDFITNGVMNASTALIGIKGHAAGGAEPVGSSLLADLNNENFNPKEGTHPTVNAEDLFEGSGLIIPEVVDSVPLIIHSDGNEHPYKIPYRLFWDYDHEMIMAGAYQVGAFGLSGSQGGWDKYISQSNKVASNNDTSFKKRRLEYIKAAYKIRHPLKDWGGWDAALLNPLKSEPVFLVLEKDLLDSAGGLELIADAGEDQTISEGQSVTLDGSLSTGDIVSYEWTSGLSMACEDSVECEVPLLSAGEHIFTLLITDSAGNIAKDDVNITVTPNDELSAPTNVKAVYLGNKQVKVTWTDTSSNETGFEISYSLGDPLATPAADAEEAILTFDIVDGQDYIMTFYVVSKNGDIESTVSPVTIEFVGSIQPNTSKLLKTGQTMCYDYDTYAEEVCTEEHKGQDGYYHLGLARSYSRDMMAQTVTDNVTGLIWQDNADAASVTRTWEGAKTECANLTLGGPWRLPTIKELQTLPDFGKVNPAIDDAFVNTTSNRYWSSTTNVHYTSSAWYVYFSYGYSYSYYKTNNYYVRCVRSGQ